MNTTTSIRIDKELKKNISRFAKQNKIAFSAAMRMLTTKALKHELEAEKQELFSQRGW